MEKSKIIDKIRQNIYIREDTLVRRNDNRDYSREFHGRLTISQPCCHHVTFGAII